MPLHFADSVPETAQEVRRLAVLAVTMLAALAPVRAAPPQAAVPTKGRALERGIHVYEVLLPHTDHADAVWIYLPDRAKQPKVPVVLIAPAGARLFHSAALGDGDRAEHLPYVRAGYAVVAYEVDAVSLGERAGNRRIMEVATRFKNSRAGVANARTALDYALSHISRLDAGRVYTAGYSFGATLSLLVAENDPRIKGCLAYAPVCNVPARVGERTVSGLDRFVPGYADFLRKYSPDGGVAQLKCPLFLFHADDDANVRTPEVAQFAALAKKTNKQVKFVRVPKGGHHDSMIRQGIPLGIKWLDTLTTR